jgi:hypothetical protein
MMKTTIVVSTLSVLLLCVYGCKGGKVADSNYRIDDSAELARLIAIQKYDEVNGIDRRLGCEIIVREEPDEWAVHFDDLVRLPDDSTVKVPGAHSVVVINKETGEVTYHKGQ